MWFWWACASFSSLFDSYALTTLPLRRQDVQTRIRLVAAPTLACTGRRLTFQRRLVTLWAWLMLLPELRPLAADFTDSCHNLLIPFRA